MGDGPCVHGVTFMRDCSQCSDAPVRPHIYFWDRRWWVSRGGRRETLIYGEPGDSISRHTFRDACHLAMLAAIHSGVWRA
jgi:hypothetical protein